MLLAAIGPYQILLILVVLAILILAIAGMWTTFQKAGKPGWASIVPIYNVIVLVEIAKKPGWWVAVLLLAGFIPVVGAIVALVFQVMLGIAIAEKFKKSSGFGVGLGLLSFVFYPILGFGDAQYGDSQTLPENDELLDA